MTDSVYFIRKGSENIFKIGIAASPHRRLQELSTAHEAELFLCATIQSDYARAVEIGLHKQWETRRINREWFSLEWEQIAVVLLSLEPAYTVTYYDDAIARSMLHPKMGDMSTEKIDEHAATVRNLQQELESAYARIALLELDKAELMELLEAAGIPVPDELLYVLPD